MNLIICLEDNNGMMFNKRRVSQDVIVREDIYKSLDGKSLIMNNYSFKMFQKDNKDENIVVSENLPIDDKENFQFIEDKHLSEFEDMIDKIIVYYWNRRYPSDFKFDIDFSNGRWEVISEEEFPGKSHEKITKKVILKKYN
ncbi:hypothetical protein [Terrisporobacter sp.]